ncbi:non-structural maintenance of chromosomes element 3 homolog [Mizuhopecten yessoensis]|uniref:Melanoma-associated antigen G1 n=1 Tax=Mizuhopecten yessoensis TaxID=6573 RepID=A0A210QHP6_MIZYE|nr:non-structural maintenance of chromosomes element 3 homolog [Mizuhopecten yessoensis]OWF48308.1 Melanoma-associated antigen G1 [Mizuhopecten yessoensis]
MPKTKKQLSKDSDEEFTPGPSSQAPSSQAHSTQAQKAAASMDPADQEKRLHDLVQYLLIMDQKKLPIKKMDINKHVLKEHRGAFPVMMKKAGDALLQVFGIELVALEDKLKGTYILVNRVDTDTEDLGNRDGQAGQDFTPVEWPEEDDAKTGLLMVILSLIFMNGQVMLDSYMWHTLKKLGIDTDFNHEVFGDSKKLITQEFAKQGYIEYTRQQNSDPPVYEFRWGQRAKQEISRKNCLDFVSQLYERDPEQWTSQWQAVLEEGEAMGTTSQD